jgi:hypothetical protein
MRAVISTLLSFFLASEVWSSNIQLQKIMINNEKARYIKRIKHFFVSHHSFFFLFFFFKKKKKKKKKSSIHQSFEPAGE